MHALIVVTPPEEGATPSHTGVRISIFPGSASPAIFPAGAAFWIGYGFTPGPSLRDSEPDRLGPGTRFELAVDGKRVELATELRHEDGLPVSELEVASFPDGLAPGWHRFVGHWYDDGKLVLTSDKTIEFVG